MPVKINQKESFDIIMSAVKKTVDLIKPTYGPASNKVIISKVTHKMVVDDGVQIARDLELNDPSENAVLQVIRETAIRTNDRAGDGTTGSLIMLQSIMDAIASRPNRDGAKIEKELKKALEEAKTQLLDSAIKISSKEDLRKVARISFDDETIANVIADTWFKLGKDAVVTVDRSGTMETHSDISSGITMNRGYISPYMVTNPERMEGVIEKPYILLTDYRLTETGDILPLMNKLVEKKITNLVVICDNMEGSALGTVILNKVQGQFNVIAINKPADMTLEDLGIMLGAKVFTEKMGARLDAVDLKDLGRARRFIARRTESIIMDPLGNKAEIAKTVSDLQAAIASSTEEKVKDELAKRVAVITNKIAVIKVGAATENEERALRYKVEDAINATQGAFRGGVVCGSGLALARLKTSSEILNEALQAPFKQLKLNVGLDGHRDLKPGEAINVVTGKIGKFMEVGVIDPVEVLIAGIDSAVSIASLLVTTSGMVVEEPKKLPQEQQ